jgi:hypothetical protein
MQLGLVEHKKLEKGNLGEVSLYKREASLLSALLVDLIINFNPNRVNSHLLLHSSIRRVRNQPQIKFNFYLKLSNSSNSLILFNSPCQLHLRRQEVSLLGSTILPRTRIQTRNRHTL